MIAITGPASFNQAVMANLSDITEGAGREILRIYSGDLGVTYKADQSPLTLADRASHDHIAARLSTLFPDIPIISEEGRLPEASERQQFERFWLVDPLDGTKEFIKRNGEFTVNIALVQGHQPIFGVVHVPTLGTTYMAVKGMGSWYREPGHEPVRLSIQPQGAESTVRVAVSRSHPNADLSRFLENFPGSETKPVGSSLKFCKIADSGIDLYPRFGPLHEWDTAAAQVVAEEAGAIVSDIHGEPLRYNKAVMKHAHVLVCRSQVLQDRVLARIKSMKS